MGWAAKCFVLEVANVLEELVPLDSMFACLCVEAEEDSVEDSAQVKGLTCFKNMEQVFSTVTTN